MTTLGSHPAKDGRDGTRPHRGQTNASQLPLRAVVISRLGNSVSATVNVLLDIVFPQRLLVLLYLLLHYYI